MNNSNNTLKVPSSYSQSNNKSSIYISPLNNSYGQYCYCKLTGITTYPSQDFSQINKTNPTLPK